MCHCPFRYYQMWTLNNIRIYAVQIVFLLVLSILFTPVGVQAQSSPVSGADPKQAVLLELIATAQNQIYLLQAQLDASQNTEKTIQLADSVSAQTVLDGALVLKRYDLSPGQGIDSVTNLEQRQYLERVYELFPEQYRIKLREFLVFADRSGQYGAFVETIAPAHDFWTFAVSADLIGEQDSDLSTELIVHELAHLISYESVAGVPLPKTASCHEHFRRRGCPKDNSYLAQFVKMFWNDADLDQALQFKKATDSLQEADSYYLTRADDYVSGYAALSPEEDFAESFAQFALAIQSPTGVVANQKIAWFTQFADLQAIKHSLE